MTQYFISLSFLISLLTSQIVPDFTISVYTVAVHVIISFSASFSPLGHASLSIYYHSQGRMGCHGINRKRREERERTRPKNRYLHELLHTENVKSVTIRLASGESNSPGSYHFCVRQFMYTIQ